MAKKGLLNFNMKLTKKEKKVLKGVAIGIGALALVGASGEVAKRFKR